MRFKKNVNIFFRKKLITEKGLWKKFMEPHCGTASFGNPPPPGVPPDPVMPGGMNSSAGLYSVTALQPGIRSRDRRWHSILSLLPGRAFPGRWRTCPQPYQPRTRIFWNVYWEGRSSQRIRNACRLRGFHQLPPLPQRRLRWPMVM